MKNHVLTTTQLRGMIKEALEESIEEIAVDERIERLRAKGSRRSLQETKLYRKLLEMKMESMDELAMGEDDTPSQLSRDDLRLDVRKVLDMMGQYEPLEKRLGKVKGPLETQQLLAALALQLADGSEKDAEKLLNKGRQYLGAHAEEFEKDAEEPLLGRQSSEEEGEILNRTKRGVMESRRFARRSR